MNCDGFGRIIGVLWTIVVMLTLQAALAQAETQNSLMDVICLTDRPAIAEGGSAKLQAWAVAPEGTSISQPISFVWQVTEGFVQGSGPEVEWDLSRVGIESDDFHKKVLATVKVMTTEHGESGCSVEVFIGKNVPTPILDRDGNPVQVPPAITRGGLRSARRFLLPTKFKKEETGFGLYSYLLFTAKPGSEEEKARYLKTLEACLRVMESVEDHLKYHRQPSELNATHIPVKTMPKYSAVPAEWAANVLAVYDYAAAQALLDKLDQTYQRGPYLVSVLKDPLSERTISVQEHLLQDFTGKVPELVSQVVDLFTYRAAQQRKWTDESFRSFSLNVRNLVAVAGKVAPEVAGTMISLVQAKQAQ